MPSSPQYSAVAVVFMDAATGFVLYENEARTQRYPTSTTKVMTALALHITGSVEEFADLMNRRAVSLGGSICLPAKA